MMKWMKNLKKIIFWKKFWRFFLKKFQNSIFWEKVVNPVFLSFAILDKRTTDVTESSSKSSDHSSGK